MTWQNLVVSVGFLYGVLIGLVIAACMVGLLYFLDWLHGNL